MAIEQIPKREFEDIRSPARLPGLIEEREWFSDTKKNFYGAVTFNSKDQDWGYVILARDEEAKFRSVDVETSLDRPEEARRQLRNMMVRYELSGQTSSPTGHGQNMPGAPMFAIALIRS